MSANNVRYAVLGLVAARPGGMHGYRLKQEIEAIASRDFWAINFGSLYRILDMLDHDGHIEAWLGEVGSRINRRVYRITEKGRKTLDDWLLQPLETTPRPLRDEFTLKLLFMDRSHLDVLAGQIRRQRSIYMGQLHRLVRSQRRLEIAGLDPGATSLVMDGARTRLLADVDWLDTVERRLLHSPCPSHVLPPHGDH